MKGRTRRRGYNRREAREATKALPPEEQARGAFAAACAMLAARSLSRGQLQERLARRGYGEAAIEASLRRLEGLGYLNDAEYALGYGRSRLRNRPVGRSRLARELSSRSLDRETVDSALESLFEEFSEEALIDEAVRKRIRTHGRPGDAKETKRMTEHLARLGFEFDLIRRKLAELGASDGEEG